MKRIFKFYMYFILLAFLCIMPCSNVSAEENRVEQYKGEVTYDDNSEMTPENMDSYIPTDCDNYEIVLEDTYNIHIVIEPDDNKAEQFGYINLNISEEEENYGFYEDILISSDGCEDNEIDVTLKPGTYQMQVSLAPYEDITLKYIITLNYTKVVIPNIKTDDATISFLDDEYNLDMEGCKTYKDGVFDFYWEAYVESELDYKATDITWKSSNSKVAAVDKEGIITSIKPGTITLTATLPNGNKASCKITVPKPVYKINKTSITMYASDTCQLSITAIPSDQKVSVKWSSNNSSIASVNSSGKVSGKKAGKCVITASLSNKQKYTCTITINKKNEIVDVSKYLNDPDGLTKKKNSSFSFEESNGKVTYIKITGKNASFKGLSPGGYDVSETVLIGYKLVNTTSSFMSEVSYFENKKTGETVVVTQVLLIISEIEYYHE